MLTSGLELLRADIVSQKGLPIKLDAVGKTARAKPSEEWEVLVEDSAVGGEGSEVHGEAEAFLERQSTDCVGGDVLAQGEAQAKWGTGGKCISGAITDHSAELAEDAVASFVGVEDGALEADGVERAVTVKSVPGILYGLPAVIEGVMPVIKGVLQSLRA